WKWGIYLIYFTVLYCILEMITQYCLFFVIANKPTTHILEDLHAVDDSVL
ncbi:hypothetical protein L9F63_016401, partial [Diploptera punctata]